MAAVAILNTNFDGLPCNAAHYKIIGNIGAKQLIKLCYFDDLMKYLTINANPKWLPPSSLIFCFHDLACYCGKNMIYMVWVSKY